jgi:hypothetical protein
MISKIIFLKNKKYYFDVFPNKKHFEKKNQNHTPKHSGNVQIMIFLVWYCILNRGWVSFKTFLFKIILFYVFGLFRCVNIKK